MSRHYNKVTLVRYVRAETDEPEEYTDRKSLINNLRQIDLANSDGFIRYAVFDGDTEIPLSLLLSNDVTIGPTGDPDVSNPYVEILGWWQPIWSADCNGAADESVV